MDYAVVGNGYWGSNHVRVAAELLEEGAIDSLTLCDVDEARVAEMAATYRVPYETDHRDLVDAGVDAAVVATPSPTHRSVATDLLAAGVDVLVEKPLELSSADAWAIVDVADAHDAVLGVGHIFRYHPALNDLKRRIDRGELGRIKYLRTNRFSFRAPRSSAGALYSLAVHDVDIYSYLLDEQPERVYCELDDTVREGIDETVTMTLSYPGATGLISDSWHVPVFDKRRDLVVVGSERSAYVDYLEDTVVELHEATMRREGDTYRAHEEGKQVHETPSREPLKVEAEAFVEASRRSDAAPLEAPGRVGAEAVELLELAEQSAENAQAVPVSSLGAADQTPSP